MLDFSVSESFLAVAQLVARMNSQNAAPRARLPFVRTLFGRITAFQLLVGFFGCDCGGGTTRARPEIEVVPGSLDFGSIAVGTSLSKKVTIFSRGAVTLTIESATILGDAAFTASGPAIRTLSPSSTSEVEVTFRPGANGPTSARLIIASNAVNAPEVLVSLVGDSLAPSGGGAAGGGSVGGGASGGSAGGSSGGSAGGSSGGSAGGSGGGSAGGTSGGSAGGSSGGSSGGTAGGTVDAGADAGVTPDAGCTLLLCGRAHAGVTCAVASQGTIGPFGGSWATSLFNDGSGWNTVSTGRTVVFGDVDGDRRADVCGRGSLGFNCALNTGSTFAAFQTWTTEFSNALGWGSAQRYYSTIQLADPNGDGVADVCGRGDAGVVCAITDGGVWRSASFTDVTSWGDPRYYPSVQWADVTGDGRSDACARGILGISCSTALDGGLGPYTGWSNEFSDADGWGSSAAYFQTVQFPDVNGDGKADVCGRSVQGVSCALSDGTQFLTSTLWTMEFSDSAGWAQRAQYATLQFPDLDGDRKADVCGRAPGGLLCARSDGTRFVSPTATQLFSDATGWAAAPSLYGTIQFADLDGDGQLDVCGRGTMGMLCALRQSGTFGGLVLTQALAADATGWNDDTVYPTIRFAAPNAQGCRIGPPANPANRVGP